MRRFQIVQSATQTFTSHSGLALIGLAINKYTCLSKSLRAINKRHGIPNIELVRAYVGQLCIGKSDFDAIENFRHDRSFRQALGIKQMPSSSRLRQRFDQDATGFSPLIEDASVEFIRQTQAPVSPLHTGHIPLDIDVFPMDNSGSQKEGVSWTYKQHDGYAPIAAYLGQEGWNIGIELREGSWHYQKEFGYVLDRVLPRAKALTGTSPILCRLDSGHDAKDNRIRLNEEQIDFLIKWNPRGESPAEWLKQAEQNSDVQWSEPRDGKRIGLYSQMVEERINGKHYDCRRVIRITERTIDKKGQRLLLPEIRLDGWWTTLPESTYEDDTIIRLYQAHATSEQFHSEFKTDLDLERLPSGKFDTNDLILTLGALSYNILRWIGLMGLTGELSPVRHPAKRRRIRTVMQELMYLAAQVIETGRRLKLQFSHYCPAFSAYQLVYNRLAYG